MCGIATIFAYGSAAPPVEREELFRIRDRMATRGPDGEGAWFSPDGRVALAHRRLAIIDLTESGAQPMTLEVAGLAITFNGEIYNYRSLRAGLEARGHRFRSGSDTEVLLALYADKGPDMLHELRGMYAFAIWDGRRRGLFLARDPFGIKPLYVADDGKTLRAASQVKALLAGGAVDRSPEPAGHAGFFLWGHVPEPYTFHKGIRALPAGTSLFVPQRAHGSAESHSPRVFCSIPDEIRAASEKPLVLEAEPLREYLRETLLDSVRDHLVSDVPVGVFLSSGLDSCTLAALAGEVASGRLHTVTLGFREYEGTENDEAPLAERVAREYGTHHSTIRVDRSEFQADRARLLDAMDQPSTDGVNSYFVSKAAVQAGLKVSISGLGGDELFGSYPGFRQIPRLVGAVRPFSRVPGLGRGFRMVTAPFLRRFTSPKYAGLLEYGGDHAGAYLLRRCMFMPWELPELIDPDMAAQGWRELRTLPAIAETAAGIPDDHLKVSSLEMSWYMRNQLLRDTDWASMAHSLEIRVPMVDLTVLRRIVPLFAGDGLVTKQDMAKTPSVPLPAYIVNRGKSGFSIPVGSWLGPDRERGLRGWARHIYDEWGDRR